MSRRKPTRPPAQRAQKVVDSYDNFVSRVGLQSGNQSAAGTYLQNFTSKKRQELENAYRSSWIVGQAVDVVADDMTKAGIDITGTASPEDAGLIEEEFDSLRVWDRLNDTIKWSRLYGGAIAVMLIDGQKLETPLRVETVGKDAFKGLMVLDRWMVQPTISQLVEDLGPDLGLPEFYDVLPGGMGLSGQRIHYSRVIRVEGVELPYWQKVSENGWGQSVVERMWDRLMAFDSTTQGAAQLVFKAHLRAYKVKGLRSVIASGGQPLNGLLANVAMIREFQSSEGITLIDAEDELEYSSYTFAGLGDMMDKFGEQLSGALQVPLVRLFGQSPGGLNSDGESNQVTYYDHIGQQQSRRLKSGVTRLVQVSHRSAVGTDAPKTLKIAFTSLWEMDGKDKAEITSKVVAAIAQLFDYAVISRKQALQALKILSEQTGSFSNITDQDINSAEDDPPDPTELLSADPGSRPDTETAQPDKGAAS